MILIFGGATEGRMAVDVVDQAHQLFYYSTRGEQQEVLSTNGVRQSGGMNVEEMIDFCKTKQIRLIVDASHPFAEQLHWSVYETAQTLSIPVVRLERMYPEREEDIIWCDDYADAITQLEAAKVDNLLALTGVQTIGKLKGYWTNHPCRFRILNRRSSLALALYEGFPEDRLCFYQENGDEYSLFKQLSPDAIITKESGLSGGFCEKVDAARQLGIKVFAVKRPALPSNFITVYGKIGLRREIERLLPEFFPLRIGYTTGSCATAASKAALLALLTQTDHSSVSITLPSGEELQIPVEVIQRSDLKATYKVIKDAGDDPDVTNGLAILSEVTLCGTAQADEAAVLGNPSAQTDEASVLGDPSTQTEDASVLGDPSLQVERGSSINENSSSQVDGTVIHHNKSSQADRTSFQFDRVPVQPIGISAQTEDASVLGGPSLQTDGGSSINENSSSQADETVMRDNPSSKTENNSLAMGKPLSAPESRIVIDGGEGVGRVTLPGLGIPIGSAAINEVPRKMIRENLTSILQKYRFDSANVQVVISVPEGRTVAERTFNPRLGIIGGISILGTSGIVRPFSSDAFLKSIQKEMEVAKAVGAERIVLNSGAKSERFVKGMYPDLPPQAFVHYGNFIGGSLQIAATLDVKRVTLGIMIGKAIKLAEGHLDTHSKKVVMNPEFVNRLLTEIGCDEQILQQASKITLARELWGLLSSDKLTAFCSLLIRLCRETCEPLLIGGELTVVLMDEDGKCYTIDD